MAKDKEQAIIEIILKGQQANASIKDMDRAVSALRSQLNKLPADSKEFAEKSKEFQQVSKRLKGVREEVNGLGGAFGKIGKEMKGLGIAALGYLGFDWLKGSVSNIIKSNAELSDSLADIRKTTGMTESEARKLNNALGQINTRTAAKELRNIAIVGGQLGIAKNDIFGFTVAVDKMNVALGDEFSGGAEEVTKAMGGLRNIFSDIKTDKVDQDLLHIGNAINELASNGAATGPVVSDFANRIGGVGITLGLTSGQVLGLSATLQELNVSTERGGTAVTKILQKMTTNTKDFAKVAGVPIEEFTKMVNTDLYGAFLKVIEGSKQSGASATAFGKILDNLGVDGAGASEVFAKLGNSTGMLNDKVKLANDSLKSTNSIMAEFNTKNITLAAEMERLNKSLTSAFTNSTIENGLKSIVGFMADLFDNSKKVSEVMEDERKNVNLLAIELGSSNTTQQRRLEIYEELKSINPSIVDGIDKENISIQRLTQNVEKYNIQAINRITIQKKQESIDKANETASEKQVDVLEKERRAYEVLNKFMQRNDDLGKTARAANLDGTLTITQKLLKVLDEVEKKSVKTAVGIELNEKVSGLKRQLSIIYDLGEAYQDFDKASAKSNDLLKEKNELMKRLGMSNEETKKIIDYTKLSTEQLNEYIRDSAESLGNWHRQEAIKSKEELLRRQKEKAAGVVEIDEKEKEKLIDEYKKFQEELKKLETQVGLDKMSKEDREFAELENKYADLRTRAKGNKKDLKRIEALYYDELMALLVKHFDRKAAEETKQFYDEKDRAEKEKALKLQMQSEIDNVLLDDYTKEFIALNKRYDDKIALAQAKGIELNGVEEARMKELADLRKKYHMDEELELDLMNGTRKAKFDDYYNAVMQILSGIDEAKRQQSENELKEVDYNSDQEIAKVKFLYNQKRISKEEYDKRIEKIEATRIAKQKQIKQEQAEREKRAAIRSAIISGFQGVAKTLGEYAYPYNLILAALHAVAAGVAVQNIQNAETPMYAGGGLHTSSNPAGFVDKPTLFSNSASGQNFIAGEAGAEWIAPYWMLQNPYTANTIGMLEGIRKKGYYAGGFTQETTPIGGSNKSETIKIMQGQNGELIAVLSGLKQVMENGIIAHLSYDDFTKTQNFIDSAKASAQVKN